MALILNLETSTKVCSVSLSKDGETIAVVEEQGEQYIHSEKLTTFIDQLFQETTFKVKELSAVGISKGPGSYTGLRIGVSVAKGLCYALQIPLLAMDSLEVLANKYTEEKQPANESILYPMIDARRMEVFTKRCLLTGEEVLNSEEIKALVVDENIFSEEKAPVFLFGDGADKFKDLFKQKNIHVVENVVTSATAMSKPMYKKYQEKEFEDVAYFEPYYLKEFIAIPSKKKLL